MMDFTYRRGDICWFNDPIPVTPNTFVTHGRHPAVIVSDDNNNVNGDTVIIAPLTSNTSKRKYAGQFDLHFNDRTSRVRGDQLRVVDKSTLEPPVAHLSPEAMHMMDDALAAILGLAPTEGFPVAYAVDR